MKKIMVCLIFLLFLSGCELFEYNGGHIHKFETKYNETHHYDYCKICFNEFNHEEHVFTDWETVKEATITSSGLRKRSCSVCNAIFEEVIPKIDHTHSYSQEYSSDSVYHWVSCSCGDEIKEEHDFSDYSISLEPTYTTSGEKTRSCTQCGYVDIVVIPPLEHTCVFEGEYGYNDYEHYLTCDCGVKQTSSHDFTYNSEIVVVEGVSYLKSYCICGYSTSTLIENSVYDKYGYKNFDQMNSNYSSFYLELYQGIYEFSLSEEDVSLSDVNDNYVIVVIDYIKYDLTSDEAIAIWQTLCLECPEFYFLSNYISYNQKFLYVGIYEEYSLYETRCNIDKQIDDMISECSTVVDVLDSDIEKAYYLHEFLIDRIDYAYKEDGTPEDASWAHNIVGMASKEGGVCESYAKSFKFLADIFKLESIIVSGQSKGQKHGWNMVNIDEEWYHIDLTWDDQEITIYNYFGLTTNDIKLDHEIDDSSTMNIDYVYPIPASASQSISLVELYENDTFVGIYKSIDDAVSSMDDVEATYKIMLMLFEYDSQNKTIYYISNFKYSINNDLALASSIIISALDINIADKFNVSTNISVGKVKLQSNVSFYNCYLNINEELNISDYKLIFNGYCGGYNGNLVKENGEVIYN